ncbi:MAG: hypothetical protein IPL46_30955 [Saprospiraceae bacterium]|nr:hypothetical protein [Saprospiraceae bacterium]
MVVTDQAAVLGNMPQDSTGYQKVSFIGQLPVRVRGPVQSGDWIVPDGEHQGVGIAISSQNITPAHQIVGQAWASSSDPGVKRVNTAVGLDHSPALRQVITAQEKRIESLEAQMQALQKMIGEQKEKVLADLGNK